MTQRAWIIWVTFLLGLALDILPLPTWVQWLRPNWTLLILIYWVMVMPYRISVGYAFMLGLVLDLLEGTLLGSHAIAMVVVVYLVAKLHKQIRMYPMQQQMLVVLLLVLLYKTIIYVIQGFIGQAPHSWLFWLAALINTLLWPWIYILLHDWRGRLHFEV